MSFSISERAPTSSRARSFTPAGQPPVPLVRQVSAARLVLVAGGLPFPSPARPPAMIAALPTVRTFLRCLIALHATRHARHPLDAFVFPSLQEDKSTACATNSAGFVPQASGKKSAKMRFDICGLIDWLRCRYPRATSINVAADTGIPAATVDNWLQGRSAPSIAHFSEMLAIYGPPLLEASFTRPTSWVTEAARMFKRAELNATIMRLQAQMDEA